LSLPPPTKESIPKSSPEAIKPKVDILSDTDKSTVGNTLVNKVAAKNASKEEEKVSQAVPGTGRSSTYMTPNQRK
jgi:hypothetical protein